MTAFTLLLAGLVLVYIGVSGKGQAFLVALLAGQAPTQTDLGAPTTELPYVPPDNVPVPVDNVI